MRQLVFISLLITLPVSSFCQQQDSSVIVAKKQVSSINLSFGDASGLSIAYERFFRIRSNLALAARLGLGYNEEFQLCIFGSCSSAPARYTTLPHSFTANFGTKKHFFEIGVGGTLLGGSTNKPYWLHGLIGYRLQPVKLKKINFRVFGCVPLNGVESDDILFAPVGISAGFLL